MTDEVYGTSPAITATYTIGGSAEQKSELANYILDPASGSTLETFSQLKVTFPDRNTSSELIFTADNGKGTITNGTETYKINADLVSAKDYKIFKAVDENGNDVTITTPGEWTLNLEKGAVYLWDFDNDFETVEESPEITATYTLTGEGGGETTEPWLALDKWASNPANGATVDKIGRITVGFPNFEGFGDYGFLKLKTSKVSLSNGSKTFPFGYGLADADETLGLSRLNSKGLYPKDEEGDETTLTEPGTYTWTFEAGAFQSLDDDEEVLAESPAFTITIKVGEGGGETTDPWLALDKWASNPANGATVDKIGRITVGFPEFEGFGDYGFLKLKTTKVSLSDGTKTYPFSYGLADADETLGLSRFNSKGFYPKDEEGDETTLTEPGTYTWTFEAGAFQSLDDDEEVLAESPAFTISLTIEGEISVDPLEFTFNPENGSTVDFPEGNLVITLDFPNATSVSPDAIEVGSVLEGGAESRGCRVLYGSEMISRVADPSTELGYSATAEGNKLILTFSHDIFAANNTLHISADEGAFGVDGECAPAFEYSLTVGEAKEYSYTITPESGTEATELATFTITFPTATSAKFIEGSYIVLVGPRMLSQYECTPVEGAEHPTFTLTFDPAPYLAGRYNLSIEAGSFILDGKFSSPTISGTYTLLRTSEVDTTITPSPTGSKVVANDYGTYVAFVFAEDETVSYDWSTWKQSVEVKFDGTLLTPGTDYAISVESDGVSYKILINFEGNSPYVGKTGTLTVTAPAGTFTISGEPSPAIDKTWKVIAPRTYEYTFSPAEGSTVASLAEITITFIEAEEAQLFMKSFVNLRATDYSSFFNLTDAYSKPADNGASVVLSFDPAPTENGNYTLMCDYSAFVIDGGIESPAIDAVFNLDVNSGIGALTAADGLFTVYSIDGRLILKDADCAALGTLEPGFYIINGKKTAIK